MNNITNFELNSSFEATLEDGTLYYPNVSYIEDTATLYFLSFKSEKNYMYIEALENDTAFTFFSDVPIFTIEYSSDRKQWKTLDSNFPISDSVNAGERIYIRSEIEQGNTFGNIVVVNRIEFLNSIENNTQPSNEVFVNYNVGGNIMSLIFGDDFEDKEDLTGYDYVFYELFSCYPLKDFNVTNGLQNAKHLLLPATTLANDCYSYMFDSCTSLTIAPELPAPTLAPFCYFHMFWGCTSLNNITMLATDISAEECMTMWVGMNDENGNEISGVAESGIFTKSSDIELTQNGGILPLATVDNRFVGVPESWVVSNRTTIYTNLSIMADDVKYSNTTTTIYYTATYNIVDDNNNIIKRGIKENGTAISEPFEMNLSTTETIQREISFTHGGLTATTVITQDLRDYMESIPFTIEILDGSQMTYYAETTRQGSMYYSIDEGLNWNLAISGESVPLSENGKYLWKGTFNSDDSMYDGIGAFMINDFNVYGNIMSLIYGDEFEDKFSLEGYKGCFSSLFRKSAPVLRPIFVHDASNLKLPATTLADSCYNSMFYSSPTLLYAPELPATTLANNCYDYMFASCPSLITTPELPATILAENCYLSMFSDCTSLTTAPQLPATTLANGCYGSMFSGCTSLTTTPELHATILAESCYSHMFSGCTSLTSASSKLPATILIEKCYSYMFYGCTSLTTAPELPAVTLTNNCYEYMFNGCNLLSNITMFATDISAKNCLQYWVSDVSSTGTFTKHPDMTRLSSGTSGIPSGWTVVDYAA